MKIEDITTEVRPRTAWESIDLGLRMVQTWSKPIILSWLVFVVPVCVILYSVLYQYPLIAIFIIWWLKPLFDRIPLYIVSHSVFGDIPSLGAIRKALPSIIKPHLIKLLLWYRFDPIRSFNLPVWQLEGLTGTARGKRARVLQKNVYGTALLLTYYCIFIQIILWMSCYALLSMLLPVNLSLSELSLSNFGDSSILPGLIVNIFALISLSIIEPFYVAGGFALYLNRRSHLEAWDIELKFRSIIKRNSDIKKTVTSAKISSIVLLVIFFGISNSTIISPAQAKVADVHYTDMSNEQAKLIVDKILATDEFNSKIKVKSWRVKKNIFEDMLDNIDDESNNSKEFSLFGEMISIIAGNVLFFLLGVALLVLIIYLLIKFSKYLPSNIFKRKSSNTPPKKISTIFGLDLAPESLPDDVGLYAWNLWQEKKFIAALSLLYRGSLSRLVNRDGVKLPYSATEGDCIKILKTSHIKHQSELLNYFESLTRMWQRAAYAQQLPERTEVQQLCENWSALFLMNNNHE